jgi:hypothetical protein
MRLSSLNIASLCSVSLQNQRELLVFAQAAEPTAFPRSPVVTQASRDYQAEVWEYAFRKIKESREQFRLKLAASDRELISEQVQE